MAISVDPPKTPALATVPVVDEDSGTPPELASAKPALSADRFTLVKKRATKLEAARAAEKNKVTRFFSSLSVAFFLYIQDQQMTLEAFLGDRLLGGSRTLPIETGSESGELQVDQKLERGKSAPKRASGYSVELTPALVRKISFHTLSLQEAIPVAQALADYFEMRRDRITAVDIIDSGDACFGGRLKWDRRLKALGQFLRDTDPGNEVAKKGYGEGNPIWIVVQKPVRISLDGVITGDLFLTTKKPAKGISYVQLTVSRYSTSIQDWEGEELAAPLVIALVRTGFAKYQSRLLPGATSKDAVAPPEKAVPDSMLPRAKEVIARLLETGVLELKFNHVERRRSMTILDLSNLVLTHEEQKAALQEINRTQLTDALQLMKNLFLRFVSLNPEASPGAIRGVLIQILAHLQQENMLSFAGATIGSGADYFKVTREFHYDRAQAHQLAGWIREHEDKVDLEAWLGGMTLEKPAVELIPPLRSAEPVVMKATTSPEPEVVKKAPVNPLAVITTLSDFRRYGHRFLRSAAQTLFGQIPERLYVTANNPFPIEGREQRIIGQLELRDKLPEDRPWAELAWVDGAVMYALNDRLDAGQKITAALVWAGLALYSWSYQLRKIRDLETFKDLVRKGGNTLLVKAMAQLDRKAAAEPFFVSATEEDLLDPTALRIRLKKGLAVSPKKPANVPVVKVQLYQGKPTILEAAGESSTHLGELLAENGLAEWGEEEGTPARTAGFGAHRRPAGFRPPHSIWGSPHVFSSPRFSPLRSLAQL